MCRPMFRRTVAQEVALKTAVGIVLAVVLGCEPIDPNDPNGTGASSTSSSAGGGASSSGGLVPFDADALCNRLINECHQPALQQDCVSTFFPLRVTSACVNAIPGASCEDLVSTTSTISTLCFPACTKGTAPVCNSDGTITLCTDTGNTHRKDCRDNCTSIGYTAWTGSCGTTYAGETAAQPQCWCR